MRRTSAQKSHAGGAIEISDGASQEQDKKMLAGRAVRSHFEQSIEILTLETENADGLDVAELALAHGECGWRNLDGIVGRALATTKSFEDVASLAAAAAAEFSHGNWSRRGARRCHDRAAAAGVHRRA